MTKYQTSTCKKIIFKFNLSMTFRTNIIRIRVLVFWKKVCVIQKYIDNNKNVGSILEIET